MFWVDRLGGVCLGDEMWGKRGGVHAWWRQGQGLKVGDETGNWKSRLIGVLTNYQDDQEDLQNRLT